MILQPNGTAHHAYIEDDEENHHNTTGEKNQGFQMDKL